MFSIDDLDKESTCLDELTQEFSQLKKDVDELKQQVNDQILEQLIQLKKENQLLRTQVNNLSRALHHSSQSMY